MKRFFTYYREHKGMSLVWITLLLFVLLVFAATAIDIAYMYYVKNQLQVAGDAAVLAGVIYVGGTDGPTADLIQEQARREAWKFACKNEAANASVYLVTTHNDCDNLPLNTDLNNSNDPNGDIVVGHWQETPFNCSAPLRNGVTNPVNFCPANGVADPTDPSLDTINAIQAYPRKTEGSPNGAAELFLGKVFRVIGIDWSHMSAVAEAIASRQPLGYAPILICTFTCTDPPLGGQDPPSLENPWYLYWAPVPEEYAQNADHGIAWTEFTDDANIQPKDVDEFFCGGEADPCNEFIASDNGSKDVAAKNFRCAFQNPLYRSEKKTCSDNDCDSLTDTVTSWKVIVPVYNEDGCPPGAEPGTDEVVQYAEITIANVYPSSTGVGCSGEGCCACDDYPYYTPPSPSDPNNAIVITGIRCVSCDEPSIEDVKPKLVK